jgi:hypothetical protein
MLIVIVVICALLYAVHNFDLTNLARSVHGG